jgi:hypothetical protein
VNERALRAVGFLLLVLGLGLIMEGPWPTLGWLLAVAGGGAAGAGLWQLGLRAGAFVAPRRRR